MDRYSYSYNACAIPNRASTINQFTIKTLDMQLHFQI